METNDINLLRIKRYLLASTSYPALITLLAILDLTDIIQVTSYQYLALLVLSLIIVATLGMIFYWKFNLLFPDPSLTALQIIIGTLWGFIIFIWFVEVRPLILMVYIPAFTFGILKFNRIQLFRLLGILLSLYIIVLALEIFWLRPTIHINYELILFACFAFVLCWIAYFGGLIHETREKLRHLSFVDDLTHLNNRRFAIQYLQLAFELDKSAQSDFSVALLDIRNLKELNLQYGHRVGDQVLVKVSQIINECLRADGLLISKPELSESAFSRESAVVARFSGKHIILILPRVNLDACISCVKNIQKQISAPDSVAGHALKIDCNASVCMLSDYLTIEYLIKILSDSLKDIKHSETGRYQLIRCGSLSKN